MIQRYRMLTGDVTAGVTRCCTDEDGIAVLHADHLAAVAELHPYSYETVRGLVKWRDEKITALEAALAEMSKPVTDEEKTRYSFGVFGRCAIWPEVNALIAARARKAPGAA